MKFQCPSCAHMLDLPDGLSAAHCIYCGSKVALPQADAVVEQSGLAQYIELGKVALNAGNYVEAIQYCNHILEIDPRNVDAWVDKALSTFWLTTSNHNRYSEAIEYVKTASQIAPGDSRVINAYRELNRLQAWWYNKLGLDQIDLAKKVWSIWEDNAVLFPDHDAMRHSEKHFIDAMEYFLAASSFNPEDMTILENIEYTSKKAGWIAWSNKVKEKVKGLEMMRAKIRAEQTLPVLREFLRTTESKLAQLKQNNLPFA